MVMWEYLKGRKQVEKQPIYIAKETWQFIPLFFHLFGQYSHSV